MFKNGRSEQIPDPKHPPVRRALGDSHYSPEYKSIDNVDDTPFYF
jgi:hypothetical protein